MSSAPTRLPAAERRQALIDAAIRLFVAGSYRGTTTADIVKEAGVSEPILYRHFASKRELYLAAVEHVWCEVRTRWEEVVATEPEPSLWPERMSQSYVSLMSTRFVLAELWVQALTEAGEDPELRKYLRKHLREVHDFIADFIRRSQEAGAVQRDRDADAEAWIFLAGGVLGTIGKRIGLLGDDDFRRIREARLEWLTGRKAARNERGDKRPGNEKGPRLRLRGPSS
ncbi:MAG: TetR/AcrR family transcriptional regulator [Gaiellaceae bacterium]